MVFVGGSKSSNESADVAISLADEVRRPIYFFTSSDQDAPYPIISEVMKVKIKYMPPWLSLISMLNRFGRLQQSSNSSEATDAHTMDLRLIRSSGGHAD